MRNRKQTNKPKTTAKRSNKILAEILSHMVSESLNIYLRTINDCGAWTRETSSDMVKNVLLVEGHSGRQRTSPIELEFYDFS